jgi:hypothetical protein
MTCVFVSLQALIDLRCRPYRQGAVGSLPSWDLNREKKMRNIITVIGATFGALLATAVPAMAEYPPPVEVGPLTVTQGGGSAGVAPAVETAGQAGGLAFTGAEIGLLVLAAAVLATIGALALMAARRRGVQTA